MSTVDRSKISATFIRYSHSSSESADLILVDTVFLIKLGNVRTPLSINRIEPLICLLSFTPFQVSVLRVDLNTCTAHVVLDDSKSSCDSDTSSAEAPYTLL